MIKMAEERVVSKGYIKLLAIETGHVISTILLEKNANTWHDIDDFIKLCGHRKNIVIYVMHVRSEERITYKDYQKVFPNIHWFDYIEDLAKRKHGTIIDYREPMD